jgi:hypothetical protein
MSQHYDFSDVKSYEDYRDASDIKTVLPRSEWDQYEQELEKEFPEYAAQMKAKADERRRLSDIEHAKYKTIHDEDYHPEVMNMDGQLPEGSTFEFHNRSYRVIRSFYVSPAESADLEDGWDGNVTPGWYSRGELLQS